MSKIAITADIHFGVPGKLQDIVWACKTLRQYCYDNSIDTVLILGDLFHNRQALEIDVLSEVYKFFEDTNQKYYQKWIAFPGNHDMFLKHSWDVNSLTSLRSHLTVIEDIKILKIDDRRFWILPFIAHEKSYNKVVRYIEKQYIEGDVLLTHIGVRGALLNTCFLLKDWSYVNFEISKFKRIYTGHFHVQQQVGENVWYPGSLIPFKFDEGDVDHGFYVYDTIADQHEFINIWDINRVNQPPQYHTILDENVKTIERKIINNNQIRVVLQKEHTQEDKREIKEHLLQLGAKSIKWMNIQSKAEIQDRKGTITIPSRNLFRAWVESDKKGVADLNTVLLHQLHSEIVTEGDEIYSREDTDLT